MFLNSIEGGMNMCEGLDVCLTQVGPAPVPIPYPNISTNDAAVPGTTGMCCLIDNMPTMTVNTTIMTSQGDEAGTDMGAVSHLIMGSTTFLEPVPYVLIEGVPATSILGATGHNCEAKLMNGPGTTLAPSQTFVMA
jgi:hypothetical protein